MSTESLAEKVNVQTPWWAAMPILAASIIAVPSFIAITSIVFVMGTVTKHLTEIKLTNQEEITELRSLRANQEKFFEMLRRGLAMSTEAQVRTCIHQAETKADREDCVRNLGLVDVNPPGFPK